MRRSFPIAVAVGVGSIVLLTWFLPFPVLEGLRWMFLDWSVLLTGVALVMAFFYFLHTQWRLIRRRQNGWGYRILVVLAATGTFAWMMFDPTPRTASWMMTYVLIPGGVSLLGLLAVVLTYRGLWMVFQRGGGWGWLFFLTVGVVLAVDTFQATQGPLPWTSEVSGWLEGVVVRAGVRGLLLGMALGFVATGLRVLSGADRPFEE